jgi:hypothetical protein
MTNECSTFGQILTAELAFDTLPVFGKLAPSQPSREEIVRWSLSEGREGHVKPSSDPVDMINHRKTNAGLPREEAAVS